MSGPGSHPQRPARCGNRRAGHAAWRGEGREGPAGAPSPPPGGPEGTAAASAAQTTVLGGCCSLEVGAGRGPRRRGLCLGGTAGRASAGGPTAAPRTRSRAWSPEGPPPGPTSEPRPQDLGVALPQPRGCLGRPVVGQLGGRWHCEAAGRHGAELNLLGAGGKLTRPSALTLSPGGWGWGQGQVLAGSGCSCPELGSLVGEPGPEGVGRGAAWRRRGGGGRGLIPAHTDACHAAAAAAGVPAGGCGSPFRGGPRGKGWRGGRSGRGPGAPPLRCLPSPFSLFYFALFPVVGLALKRKL